MPEWPDLHVIRARLAPALAGRRVHGVKVGDPVVLRSARPPEDVLFGRTFGAVTHRGKFLVFALDGVTMVVNPMLSGLFELQPAAARETKDLRLTVALDDGRALRYRDDTRMGKVYLLEGAGPETVPGYADLGPDAFGIEPEDLVRRAKARGGDVRNLLMDQRILAGIGNAYADEILFDARIHPKRAVRTLTADELRALADSVHRVLARAVDEVEAATPPELGTKPRGHMKVRGREGEPCPRCGARIKRTRKGDDETYLCATCQPPPKGQLV